MKPLTRDIQELHHTIGGERVDGPNPYMSGDCSRLRGNCTGLRGNCTGLSGDLSQIPRESRPCNIADWVEG